MKRAALYSRKPSAQGADKLPASATVAVTHSAPSASRRVSNIHQRFQRLPLWAALLLCALLSASLTWALTRQAGTPQRLTQDDQRLIVDAYTAKQAAIQTISQAAE